jgi:hypothetical protein
MIKRNFRLNQAHWKYSVKISNGINEERLYEETDEDLYGDAFESDNFDEMFEDNFIADFPIAA